MKTNPTRRSSKRTKKPSAASLRAAAGASSAKHPKPKKAKPRQCSRSGARRQKPKSNGPTRPATATSSSSSSSSFVVPTQQKSILLSAPTDSLWLSPALCLLRSQIEYFAATPTDLTHRHRSGGNKAAVVVGQVGLRCVHCKMVERTERTKGSELFPSNLGLVHQAVRNYQRHHYKTCPHIPSDIRSQIEEAKSRGAGGGSSDSAKVQSKSNSKEYWSQSARELGLVDHTTCHNDDEEEEEEEEREARGGIFFVAKGCAAADEEGIEEEKKVEAEADAEADAEVQGQQPPVVAASAAAPAAAAAAAVPDDVHHAAAATAEALPFDSIALFGPGLGFDDDDHHPDHGHAEHGGGAPLGVSAAVGGTGPHGVGQQVQAGNDAAAAAAPNNGEDDDDDAIFEEALAILSDDADGDDDGEPVGEPTPLVGAGVHVGGLLVSPSVVAVGGHSDNHHPSHRHHGHGHGHGIPYHHHQQPATGPHPLVVSLHRGGVVDEPGLPTNLPSSYHHPNPQQQQGGGGGGSWYAAQALPHVRDRHPLSYAGDHHILSSSSSSSAPASSYQVPNNQQGQNRGHRQPSITTGGSGNAMNLDLLRAAEQQHLDHLQSFQRSMFYPPQQGRPGQTDSADMKKKKSHGSGPSSGPITTSNPTPAAAFFAMPAPAPLPMPLPLPSPMTGLHGRRSSSVVSQDSDREDQGQRQRQQEHAGHEDHNSAKITPATSRNTSYGSAIVGHHTAASNNKRPRYE